MFNSIFELLTTVADVSELISLKKTFDNSDQLKLMQRLDKQDDVLFGDLLANQKIIIKLLGELIMNIKKIMSAIIDKGKKEDMYEMGEIFEDMLYDLKNTNKAWYKSIKYKMYKLAYGDHLNEELAHEWVNKMKNKDGTMGEHWTYEQTESVRHQYAPELNSCDFYAVLNSIYSDYYDKSLTTDNYVKLAIDFINDKDSYPDKPLRYYMFIV